MAKSVLITTPFPSIEEVGKSLGISKARQKSLMKIMLEPRSRADHKKAARLSKPESSVSPTHRRRTRATRAAQAAKKAAA